MISVEHMDELIVRFRNGELDIRDIIEQSYFGGRADAIDECLSILASAYMNQDGLHEAYRKIEKLKEPSK